MLLTHSLINRTNKNFLKLFQTDGKLLFGCIEKGSKWKGTGQ